MDPKMSIDTEEIRERWVRENEGDERAGTEGRRERVHM